MTEEKQGSFPDQVGGRACPAYVGVGQAAKRRDMGVEAGERNWRPEEPQGIVDCMDESVDRVQEVVVAAERARVDVEAGSVVEMVLVAHRSFRSCEIEICDGSGCASVSRSVDYPVS